MPGHRILPALSLHLTQSLRLDLRPVNPFRIENAGQELISERGKVFWDQTSIRVRDIASRLSHCAPRWAASDKVHALRRVGRNQFQCRVRAYPELVACRL